MFQNIDGLRQEALHFQKYGFYTAEPYKTPGWRKYWKTQLDRCINGYTANGISITGNHYHYLNFTNIKITKLGNEKVSRSASKSYTFPDFWDGDYEYFWLMDIARHGASAEFISGLNLESTIHPDFLDGGRHLMVGKARRKGFSYKNGSVSANLYNTVKRSKTLLLAYDKKYLYPDGIMRMAVDNINFHTEHTAWGKRRQRVNQQMHVKASYLEEIAGREIEKGYKSEIQAITMKDNPDATRGKDANLIIMEEAGAFDNLKDSFSATLPCVQDGGFTTGQIIMFGTGGDMEGGTIDFESMFHDPMSYDILPVENIWDEAGRGTWCSFFFPSYKNKIGFIDENGNSLEKEAKAEEAEKREELRKHTKDISRLDKYVTEYPWNPSEAFRRLSNNKFPVASLQAHKNDITRTGLFKHVGTHGDLVDTGKGIKFVPNKDARPILKFPVDGKTDTTGTVTVYQSPYLNQNGEIPYGLYKVIHDPYAMDSGTSLGAAYVIKMSNNFSQPDDIIVASYVGRPETQDDYNEILFNLARYYNAKIGFENDRGDVIGYAKRFKLLSYLEEEAEIIDKSSNFFAKKLGRNYGMSMGTGSRKKQAIQYLRDWLITKRSKNEKGEYKLNLHYIYDLALLEELIKYDPDKGNFDRVSALLVGMYFIKNAYNVEVEEEEDDESQDDFFGRDLF